MRIGVLYNRVEEGELLRGTPSDIIAENEVLDTVHAVKSALEKNGHRVFPLRVRQEIFSRLKEMNFDIVFNLAEGIGGDTAAESKIPAMLDMFGIPYTGSNSLALSLCNDKFIAKCILSGYGITTPRYQLFVDPEVDLMLNFPLIVKPVGEHASIGIGPDSVANDDEELRKKIRYINEVYLQAALVEEYIDGRELNVPILGTGEGARVFPVSEIVFSLPNGAPKIVNYEAKWTEESDWFKGTTRSCPAVLAGDVRKKVEEVALKAYRVMGCRDYGRVDIRLMDDVPYVLEVNPNPCINPSHSGFVASMEAGGLGFDQAVGKILESAMDRAGLKTDSGIPGAETIQTENLVLKPIGLEDIDILLKWFNDEENLKFMEDVGYATREYLELKIMTASHDRDFMVCLDKRPIGFASIYNLDMGNGRGEISFLIGEKEFQRKGYGVEIARALEDFAFKSLEVNSLFASATVSNIRSTKTLQKAGFKKIGIRREYQRMGGEFLDEVFFDLTEEDYGRLIR